MYYIMELLTKAKKCAEIGNMKIDTRSLDLGIQSSRNGKVLSVECGEGKTLEEIYKASVIQEEQVLVIYCTVWWM
jgi:hypothetical protein